MQGVLRFKLPEERIEFEDAQKGVDYKLLLNEFDDYLRSKIKYENLKDAEYDIYKEIRQKLHDMSIHYDVSL